MTQGSTNSAPVDLSRIKDTADGDTEFEKELLAMYTEDTELRMNELSDKIAAGDAAGVRLAAHTIKGSSANVGAESMRAIAGELETLAVSGELAAAGGILDRLKAEFTSVRAFLGAHIASLG